MTFPTRRTFLESSAAGLVALPLTAVADESKPEKRINVVVWDEQQPTQKEAYPDFLGNWIAKYLESRPGFAVKSVKQNDPEKGLSDEVVNDCQVLIWWGHVRQADIKPETGKRLVQ